MATLADLGEGYDKRRSRAQPEDPSVDTFEQRWSPLNPIDQQLYAPPPDLQINPPYQERFRDPSKVISGAPQQFAEVPSYLLNMPTMLQPFTWPTLPTGKATAITDAIRGAIRERAVPEPAPAQMPLSQYGLSPELQAEMSAINRVPDYYQLRMRYRRGF